MRLDIFLKYTGLIKQRNQAKRACDQGNVVIINGDGKRSAKAGQSVHVGERICIQLTTRRIEIEVLKLPHRAPSKKDRLQLYRQISEVIIEPYSDLSF